MSFFIRNKTRERVWGQSKRKLTEAKIGKGKDFPLASKKKKLKAVGPRATDNEEILSDSDIGSDGEQPQTELYESSEEEDLETAQEKRLRLAKEYLSQLETQEKEKEGDELEDAITGRLKQDALERLGKQHKDVADQITEPTPENIHILHGHQLPVTCIVLTPDDQYIFSAGKDCSIIKWNLRTRKKVKTIHGGRKGTETTHIGHTSHIHCLAISSDGKYLVSGDENKNIMAWNPETCERLHIFTGHRGPVTGVAFRKGSHQLFSTSKDRTVKIWNLEEMAYVETLFGHQDIITGVDSLTKDRALTAGGRDRSVRMWKVVEESQLVFHGHNGSIDCVSLIDEEHFVSGADDNSLAMWSLMKKRPAVMIKNAHGESKEESWITAVTALHYSDLVASGSKDGLVRLWKCGTGYRTMNPLFSIPIKGFVNSLKFTSSGEYLVVGVGQEHRLGRWWRIKEAKNGIVIVKLRNDQ